MLAFTADPSTIGQPTSAHLSEEGVVIWRRAPVALLAFFVLGCQPAPPLLPGRMDPPYVKSSTERVFQRNIRLAIAEITSEKITYTVVADESGEKK